MAAFLKVKITVWCDEPSCLDAQDNATALFEADTEWDGRQFMRQHDLLVHGLSRLDQSKGGQSGVQQEDQSQ